MRVPPNKRHLVVNKEYSRLPYWTDDGFEDVQRQTSQKYVQDSFGAFAESENQLPYLSDVDYQELEYRYQNPEFPEFPDIPINPDTVPKGTCYQLWVSLFGDATGAFIPNASEWNKLNEYAKKCPLIYMPHICCLNMKITGPDSVAPGDTVEYSVSGGGHGCAYDINAERGEFIGYKYTAPTTPGSDRLSIKPWMSDDQNTICAYKDITIEGGCKGTAHATTPQMAAGASQTLYIEGGSEGDTYYWSTTSGSLSYPTGTSVTYTAPATNPNCVNNPTITVTCGGATIGTLTIAVNAYTPLADAYTTYTNYACVQGYPYGAWETRVFLDKNMYRCDGTLDPNTNFSVNCKVQASESQTGGPPPCGNVHDNVCFNTCGEGGSIFQTHLDNPLVDGRPQWLKEAGCCPAALI
jgi:hypothetical protein